MLSNNEQLTPVVTKTTEVVGISPLTMANVAQDTDNLGNLSPVGGSGASGTMQFADHLELESTLDSSAKVVATHVAVTPKKTVLPEDYDSETGSTPHDDWRILNHRVNCSRPSVPGHTSTPSKWPGPFYVDTPPSSK